MANSVIIQGRGVKQKKRVISRPGSTSDTVSRRRVVCVSYTPTPLALHHDSHSSGGDQIAPVTSHLSRQPVRGGKVPGTGKHSVASRQQQWSVRQWLSHRPSARQQRCSSARVIKRLSLVLARLNIIIK